MRRSERERLDRRKQYQQDSYALKRDRYVLKTILQGGQIPKECYTKEQIQDYESETNVSRHEASHAVAFWMLGVEIAEARLSSVDEDGEVIQAQVLPRMDVIPQSVGERTVVALQHAFISLAGVFGSGNAESDNPIWKIETKIHKIRARDKLRHIGNMSAIEAVQEIERLIPVVREVFKYSRVQKTVNHLAENLVRFRILSGEKVTACAAEAWNNSGCGPGD